MDVGQGFSLSRYLRFCAAGVGDDDSVEQAFGMPAFDDHFFGEIQYLSESSHGEIALAEVWVVAGEALFLQGRSEIFGEINYGPGGKVGDGCHDY